MRRCLNDFGSGFVSMEFEPCRSEFEHVPLCVLFTLRTINIGQKVVVRTQRDFNSVPFHARVVFVWQWHIMVVL
jgi:hypothetical protein